ncbi:sugar transferase [Patescibacteria group bacterium]|nr:sugar transferase [Patescibacteria group bacterium]MDE1946389.1 sugar transferase [Patescibacteria group bacterium]MDE2233021.1 sugar transferase [Patescibacteria group bacterium]
MTRVTNSKRALILIAGDLVAYLFSLILTLTVRYGQLPDRNLLSDHIPSFSVLFVLFVIVNFSAGLYDKQSAFGRGKIQGLLIKAQIANIFVGTTFFYLAPVLITPKANLAIFFVISTALLFLWRTIMFPVLIVSKPQAAILVGVGDDIDDLFDEINAGGNYGVLFTDRIALGPNTAGLPERISESLSKNAASIIVADLHDKTVESAMPFLYSQIFSGKQVIDAGRLYEAVFDRIPLSMVGERWLLENAGALGGHKVYDSLKRVMDIAIASVVGLVSLAVYPFIYLAIKIEDRGRIFIRQERIGRNGKPIEITKFRSMTGNDGGAYGSNGGKTSLTVTRVGKILRFTRIDELPQLWSVLKGDQSLIGPRPEFPSLVAIYKKEIPYYDIRHLIKPGLSGWAQIYHKKHPHHEVNASEARNKLFYDMYYIKNRSLTLDIRIALQTAQAILSRQGV